MARIKRHAPRCDLQAASCHHARSRLNSVCATRFGNAILANLTGIPIARRVECAATLKPVFREEESGSEGRSPPTFSLAISPTLLSFIVSSSPLASLFTERAKCKTRVESFSGKEAARKTRQHPRDVQVARARRGSLNG